MKTVKRRRLAVPAAVVTAGLVLAACGGSSGSSSNASASGAPSRSAGASGIDKTPFKFAFPDQPDVGNLAVVVTLKKLAAEGYNDSYVALSGTTSAVAALSSNDVQAMDLAGPGTFKAIAKGDPFQVFGMQYVGEDALVAAKSVGTVAQLTGKRIALASATTLSAALLNASDKKAGVKPDIVYLGSSSVRAGALVSGKIDATMLNLDDVAKVLHGPSAANFHVLIYYPTLYPFLLGNVFSTTRSFYSQHPGIIKAILTTYNQTIADSYSNPTGFIQKYGSLLKGITEPVEQKAMQESVQGKIWGTSQARISQSQVTQSLSFYKSAGILSSSQAASLASSESKWLVQP